MLLCLRSFLKQDGGSLPNSPIKVLVAEDFESWRRFHCSTLQEHSRFQVIGEVSDGLEAVHEAQNLQPDLILLDVGLPTLNGIEAARRIRELSPASRILFVSENQSVDIVEEALRIGACGYVVKSDAARELLFAVNAVLEGRRYVSASLDGCGLSDSLDHRVADHSHLDRALTAHQPKEIGITRHEVEFYSEDRCLLADVTHFIGRAIKAGNAAIVVATESHRERVLLELQTCGVDVIGAIAERRYIALDAFETLSMFMVKGRPDPGRLLELLGDLIITAREAAKGEHPRVALFGECVNLLLQQGNARAAIDMERLGNQLTQIHDLDILCGYSLNRFESGMDADVFQQICAEHSAVHSSQ